MNETIDFLLKKGGLLLAAGVLLTGCAWFGTDAPLKPLSYDAVKGERQPNLILFLRGRGGSHRSFAKEGFVAAVRERGLPFDMVAPNSHLGYYVAETLVPRLREDIIDPAKARGYEKIWLVGASMGGLGALMYLRAHPGDVDGVYIISPFLGYQEMVAEIAEAGGVRSWSPGEYDPGEDWERMLWDWLKGYAADRDQRPPVFLGYGTGDAYIQGQKLLAEILPPDRVFTVEGGHTPETMYRLWLGFLDRP